MMNIVHLCIDPLRVFCDSTYDPPIAQKPLNGSGKGNSQTEAAVDRIIEIVHAFNKYSIPTYWAYMEIEPYLSITPYGIEKSGGGLHPKLKEAFPNYAETAIHKYKETVFSDLAIINKITGMRPDVIVGSGFATNLCVRSTLCDPHMFYGRGELSNVARCVIGDATSNSDGSDNKETLDSMQQGGVNVINAYDVPQWLKHLA